MARLNLEITKPVAKLNIIGGTLMIYFTVRSIDKGYFIGNTFAIRAIVFVSFMLYFATSLTSLLKKIKINPKDHLDSFFLALIVILISELINLFEWI